MIYLCVIFNFCCQHLIVFWNIGLFPPLVVLSLGILKLTYLKSIVFQLKWILKNKAKIKYFKCKHKLLFHKCYYYILLFCSFHFLILFTSCYDDISFDSLTSCIYVFVMSSWMKSGWNRVFISLANEGKDFSRPECMIFSVSLSIITKRH